MSRLRLGLRRGLTAGFTTATLASLLLTACGGGPASGVTPEATTAGSTQFTTKSGFVCPEPQPKLEVTSKDLNLFVWTEYVPEDMVECFSLVYGINVNMDVYSNNEEMYAKLSAGSSNYDIVQPTDYIVGLMVRNGLLQKLDHSQLPNLKNFDPTYLNLSFDPNNEYTVPYQAGSNALVYDAETVKTPPTKWADLWNPEYAGNLVLLDDSRSVIGFVLLTLGYDVNTTDPAQLEEAKVKLAELAQNVKLFDSDSPKTALIGGEVNVGMTWTGEAFLAAQAKPSITFVYPEEGAIVWQDNSAIPTAAPHADAAYAWLNYTAQGDVFWLMLRDFPYTNPVATALDYAKTSEIEVENADGQKVTPKELYAAYMASPITNMPAEELAKGHRIDDVGDATPLYDEIWTEIKQ